VTPEAAAARVAELFPAMYLRFHRRDEPRSDLGAAARATLVHLANTGPLTVGEIARHLSRAQSVVSEIVDHLVDKGLLERMRDAKDRRRTLVWLSDAGFAALERDREVLSRELLLRATRGMTPVERENLVAGMSALLATDDGAPAPETTHVHDTNPKAKKRRPR
jgi:DNA-binding MarR family transcriptional regulator